MISIYEYMKCPELLDKESLYEIRGLLQTYPYFQTLRLLYLQNLYILGDKSFDDELHKSAIYLNERKVLFSIIEGKKYGNNKQEETKKSDDHQDRTESLIDAFLSTKEEDVEKMKLSMEATTDYASLLINEKDEHDVEMRGQKLIDDFVRQDSKDDTQTQTEMMGQKLIDGFVNKDAALETQKDDEVKEKVEENSNSSAADDEREADSWDAQSEYDDDEESYFTETLAKIYVKQGKYSKAIEIIKKLNLKYPKKNVYFADQIRFLEKLIINTKSK